MAHFGSELRNARELRGWSIQALSLETKIQLRHLEAMEQEAFHELPGGIFRRGILRAYLHVLQLDEQEWMPRFEATASEQARQRGEDTVSMDTAWVQFASNVKKNRARQRRNAAGRWAGVGALLVLLGLALYALWILELRGLMSH